MKKDRSLKSSSVTGFKLSVGRGMFNMELNEVDSETLIKVMSSARKTLIIATVVAVIAGGACSNWGLAKIAAIYDAAERKVQVYLRAP